MNKKAVICGGGGFIGSHLVNTLKNKGYYVRAVDIKNPEFSATQADDFILGDLRDPSIARKAVAGITEIYQLAADMGGMGYIEGTHDASIMHNSVLINLNVLEAARHNPGSKVFYSSSACIYPEHNQLDPDNPKCIEGTEYPAAPDTDYGWEKLFSERLYQAYARNYGLTAKIARFHNVFGPHGTWQGGREKAPAALCRKITQAPDNGTIEVWGDGLQTRSFLYIEEALIGVEKLMQSDFDGPVNIGSEEMISINDLAELIAKIAGKKVSIKNIPGPQGVRGRCSDNRVIQNKLNWQPNKSLEEGLTTTYAWIAEQVEQLKPEKTTTKISSVKAVN